MKVIIDAGHGGYDNGAIYKDRREKDDNLALSLLLRDKLEAAGVDVVLTRDSDVYNSPAEKADIANSIGGDLLVSLHRNAAYTPNTYQGVQTLVYSKSGPRLKVATEINEELENIGFNIINVEARPDLAVLRKTKMPAVLVESGFIDNDYDNMLFDNNFDDIAQGIANAIINTMGSKRASVAAQVDSLNDVTVAIDKEPEEERKDTPSGREVYRIQLGYFNNYCYAKSLERELCLGSYDTFLEEDSEGYVVYVGPYNDLKEAEDNLGKLKLQGYDAFIV